MLKLKVSVVRIIVTQFVLLASLASGAAHAQYASVEQDRAAKRAAQEAQLGLARTALVGRQFWIEPNAKAVVRVEFYATNEDGMPTIKRFVVTEPVSFKVVEFQHFQ